MRVVTVGDVCFPDVGPKFVSPIVLLVWSLLFVEYGVSSGVVGVDVFCFEV